MDHKAVSQTATLSTEIDTRVKKAAVEFCKRRGMKLRYLVEHALVEQLEDEIDLEAYRTRKGEETVSLEKILSGASRSKKS